MRAVTAIVASAVVLFAGFAQAQNPAPSNNGSNIVFKHNCPLFSECESNECVVDTTPGGQCLVTPDQIRWFNCYNASTTCIRGRYFSDASCSTPATKQFVQLCDQCQEDISGNLGYFKYICASSESDVGAIRYNCSYNCQSCQGESMIPTLGQCLRHPVRGDYYAVNNFPECGKVELFSGPECKEDDTAFVSMTVPQGSCLTLDGNNELSITCPGYVKPAFVEWLTPFVASTQPDHTLTTTSNPTTTMTTTSSGTSSPNPSTTTTTPAPTPPPTVPTGTRVQVQSCTDNAYCKASTCSVTSNDVQSTCQAAGSSAGHSYECLPPNTKSCIYAKRYSDGMCSELTYAEYAVCDQCVKTRAGYMTIECDMAAGTVFISQGCDSACQSCSSTHQLAIGGCSGGNGNWWVVGSKPFVCSAVNRTSYTSASCAAGTATGAYLYPQDACHNGDQFRCSDFQQPPTQTTAAPPPSVPASAVAAAFKSTCSDIHCSFNCSTQEDVTGCIQVSFPAGQAPALAQGETTFTRTVTCGQSFVSTAAVTFFNDSSCTHVDTDLSIALDTCQRSFRTGRYFVITGSLLLRDACDDSCTTCSQSSQLGLRQCLPNLMGQHLVVNRISGPTNLVVEKVFKGEFCQGSPIVVAYMGANQCNMRGTYTCAANPTDAPPGGPTSPPPPTTARPTTPSIFVATFTQRPDKVALNAALTANFGETVTVSWIDGPNAVSCGSDTCYEARFSMQATDATRAAFLNMESTASERAELRRLYYISSLSAPPSNPPPSPGDDSGDKTVTVVVALIGVGVFIVLVAVGILFMRTRRAAASSGRPSGSEGAVSSDYVPMHERSAADA